MRKCDNDPFFWLTDDVSICRTDYSPMPPHSFLQGRRDSKGGEQTYMPLLIVMPSFSPFSLFFSCPLFYHICFLFFSPVPNAPLLIVSYCFVLFSCLFLPFLCQFCSCSPFYFLMFPFLPLLPPCLLPSLHQAAVSLFTALSRSPLTSLTACIAIV